MRHLARAAAGGLLCLLVACAAAVARGDEPAGTKPADAVDPWAPLAPMLGRWEGKSNGSPGAGTVRREYRLVLGGRFIEVRNQSTYPPQPKNPKGEVHEDVGYVSHDRARRAFVLRQFHVEGFVNTYVAPAPAAAEKAAPIVFTSEAIENIAPGWRARETYRFPSPDVMVEVFELAAPGKHFEVYTETRLERVKGP
jgi:hypothetical protein